MERTGCIYSILCKVNGKRYIGQTINGTAERWRAHLQEAKQHSHRPLYRAINKYGAGMFVIREIESDIPYSQLSEREEHWIKEFDTYNEGYNLTTGGEQSYTMIIGSNRFWSTNIIKELLYDIHERADKAIIVDVKGDYVRTCYRNVDYDNLDIVLNLLDQRSSN